MAHDPHLAFNAVAQRAHDKVNDMRFGMTLERVRAGGDELGVGRVIAALRLIMEA